MADESRGSLADAVADWTPPWQRAAGEDEPERERDDRHEPGTDGHAKGLAAEVAGWTPPWRRAGTTEPEPGEASGIAVEPSAGTPTEPVDAGEPDTDPVTEALADTTSEPETASTLVTDPIAADPIADMVSEPVTELIADEPNLAAEEPAPAVEHEAAEEPREDEPRPEVDDLPGTLEAILMVVDEPVGEIMLAQNLGRTNAEIAAALERLSAEYTAQSRGFDLRKQAGGWRFYTRDEYAPHVERFVLDGQQARLTKAALETLAVVAYKQPVTRARISGIRGVNCDGVIRTLLSRGLVEECGSEPDTGAHLYRTTVLFLEKLGINSIAELPPLAPFLPDDLDELTEGALDG